MQNIHANLRELKFGGRLRNTSHSIAFDFISHREIMNLEYPTPAASDFHFFLTEPPQRSKFFSHCLIRGHLDLPVEPPIRESYPYRASSFGHPNEVSMRHKFIVRALFFLLLGATFWSCTASAQSSGDTSVADAARRAREKKKTADKPVAVITNDTLPSASPTDTAVSSPQAGAQANSAATSSASQPAAPTVETPEDANKKKAEIEALKQEIADKQKSLDIEQRELALDSDTFLSKPDFEHDKDGKAKLDAMQADLQQKQDEIAKLKSKLASIAPVGALPADSPKP